MKFHLQAIGTKMPSWVNEGFQQYSKRLQAEITLHLKEIPAEKRPQNYAVQSTMQKEGAKLLQGVKKTDYVIALDVKGKALSTENLATRLEDLSMHHGNVYCWVGGPDGLSKDALSRANEKWSLSALTLPHPLVRIVLAEQIYRAWTVMKGHPYHK